MFVVNNPAYLQVFKTKSMVKLKALYEKNIKALKIILSSDIRIEIWKCNMLEFLFHLI